MPIYIVKANFYYPYESFSEGDKRMHMSKVIEAGTKFSSDANEYILELLRSGIIEEYREVVSDKVLTGGSSGGGGGESEKVSGQSGQEKGEKKEKEKK